MTSPTLTALTDQAEAAAMHSLTSLARVAHNTGAQMTYHLPGPVSRVILARLENGLLRGTVGFCEHLSATAPAVALWAPWAAGKVRCAPCANNAYKRVKGTAENKKCDRCRRRMVVTNTYAVQLPAVVLTLPDGAPRAIPPMQVHYGLCAGCREADQDADGTP